MAEPARYRQIQEYTENLLAHLLPLDKSIEYKLFYSSLYHDLPHYSWLELPNVRVVRKKIPSRILFLTSYFFNWPKLDQLVSGADVFFFPHFFVKKNIIFGQKISGALGRVDLEARARSRHRGHRRQVTPRRSVADRGHSRGERDGLCDAQRLQRGLARGDRLAAGADASRGARGP